MSSHGRCRINGQVTELQLGASVESVVRELVTSPAGVAVACNGELVARSAWASTPVRDGDQLEILSVAPGG